VTEMAHSASLLNSRSEFDSFLFAPVGDDEKGMVVSVLSAFARLDFDPWQEAAEFAQLPKETAKTRLAALIAALPGMSPADPEPGTVAARLIALLPGQAGPAVVSRKGLLGAGQAADLRSPKFIISVVFFVALTLVFQIVMASHQSPTTIDGAQAQTVGTTNPQTPVPSLGDGASKTGSVTGDVMTNYKPRNLIDLHGQQKKVPVAPEAQQNQSSAAVNLAPATTPVRRPLFGR